MNIWKKCSNCKTPIYCGQEYQSCSVSTCNHVRTGLQFCSVSCWSGHVPVYRHKEAWAIEKTAPLTSAIEEEVSATPSVTPAKSIESKKVYASLPTKSASASKADEEEILVVVSKLKKYISDHSEMSTSADVMDKLSQHLRALCLKAIKNAENSGRKTVMARDFLH